MSLDRENRELRGANEILRSAAAFLLAGGRRAPGIAYGCWPGRTRDRRVLTPVRATAEVRPEELTTTVPLSRAPRRQGRPRRDTVPAFISIM